MIKEDNFLEQKKENLENERLIYTVQEVAALLHSSPNYIYELINNGFLPALKLGSIKILKTTLEKFLQENEGKDLSNINYIKKLEINNLNERKNKYGISQC